MANRARQHVRLAGRHHLSPLVRQIRAGDTARRLIGQHHPHQARPNPAGFSFACASPPEAPHSAARACLAPPHPPAPGRAQRALKSLPPPRLAPWRQSHPRHRGARACPRLQAPVDTQAIVYLLCHGLRACFCCIKRRFETEKRQMSQRLFHSKPLKNHPFSYYYYK